MQKEQHPFNSPLSGTTRVSRYQKGKTTPDLLEQETVSGSGIGWAICKSTPWPRHITTSASHHSSFLQAGCPFCHPTNSVKAMKADQQYILHSSISQLNRSEVIQIVSVSVSSILLHVNEISKMFHEACSSRASEAASCCGSAVVSQKRQNGHAAVLSDMLSSLPVNTWKVASLVSHQLH